MDLSKIETLIAFVGRSEITELTVTEKGTVVRIFRERSQGTSLAAAESAAEVKSSIRADATKDELSTRAFTVSAPIFGVLHSAPAPGDPPFVVIGDDVAEGQTLFIIEAMKVFNKISAPRSGKIIRLTEVNSAEVEAGDMLAEIA